MFAGKQSNESRGWITSKYLKTDDTPHFSDSLMTSDKIEERYKKIEGEIKE
jgi:hypothetical protein